MIKNAKILGVGVNSDDYHGQTAERGSREFFMSSSSLRAFGQCPQRWRFGYSSPDSDAKQFGSLVDTRLLTPDQFQSRYSIQPSEYKSTTLKCPLCSSFSDSKACRKCKVDRIELNVTKPWNGNSTVCAEWVGAQGEKTVVTKTLVEECDQAIKRLKMDDVVSDFLNVSETQVHIAGEWQDEKTGLTIPIQCLLDLVPALDSHFASVAGDLKTTRSAAVHPWTRFCYQMGYHVQAAFGLDLLNAAEGTARDTGRQNFVFVLVENFAPWQTAKRMLSGDFLDLGRMEYTRLLGNYAACVAAGKWPGYDDHSDAVQGWTLVRPEQFMSERALDATACDFTDDPPDDEEPAKNDDEEMGVML